MTRRARVLARVLGQSVAIKGQFSRSGKNEIMLTFEQTRGLAGMDGRETMAFLTGRDFAAALGAIPAGHYTDIEDYRAYVRLEKFLKNW